MSGAWEDAKRQARARALLAEAEASWLEEDPVVAADLRLLTERLRDYEVARDHLLVIRARLDGQETFGYSPEHLAEATRNYLMTSGEIRDVIQRLAERWADDNNDEETP